MNNENRPSKKQHELLTFIGGFIAQHGYGPSYREIMRALGYKSVSTVAVHVDNLIKKGLLQKRDKSARSLEVCSPSPKTKANTAKQITENQEKWLVNAVSDHFTTAEKNALDAAELDGLYVLVGALHILGFPEAARSYQTRLRDLKTRLESAK